MSDDVRDHDQSMDESDAFADALNAALDGNVSADVPDVAALTSLLATMRAVQQTPLADGEVLSARRRDDLWAVIVGEATPRAISTPAHAAGFQATYPLRNRLVAGWPRRGQGGEPSGHPVWRSVGSWVSMALIGAMLLAMGSMVWSLRPGADGDHSLLASATSLAVGTALASPSPMATEGDGWMRWPVQEDCNVEPMPHDAYARIMSTQPDISGRSYQVAGTPPEGDAAAAADAARTNAACGLYGLVSEARTTESAAHLFFSSSTSSRTISVEESNAQGLEGGMLISATAPAREPSAYAVILDTVPPSALLDRHRIVTANSPLIVVTYDPENALLLADGRIGIPATALYWKDDFWQPQQWQIDESDSFSTLLVILTDSSGSWMVDEQLTFCPYAGCYATWESRADQFGVPVPALDIPVPWTIPTGTATPVASPVSA